MVVINGNRLHGVLEKSDFRYKNFYGLSEECAIVKHLTSLPNALKFLIFLRNSYEKTPFSTLTL
jgi:hypothetical protein